MSAPDPPRIRTASRDDAVAVVGMLAEGVGTYRDFAPGWRPPSYGEDTQLAAEWVLSRPQTFYLVAEDASGHAGQCGFHPAHEERMMRGARIPGLAHFWQLFVRRDLWGSGLADTLHGMSVAEIRARGYERARLFTPGPHERARAFYEKRGWRTSGRSVRDLGEPPLELLEYVLEVGVSGPEGLPPRGGSPGA